MAEPLYLHATHIISFINSVEVKNKNVSDREILLDMMDDEFSRSQWWGDGRRYVCTIEYCRYFVEAIDKIERGGKR